MNGVLFEEDATASIKSPETPEQIPQLQTDRSAVQIPKSCAGMAARSHYMTTTFSYISTGMSWDNDIPSTYFKQLDKKQYPENFDHFEEVFTKIGKQLSLPLICLCKLNTLE